MNGYFKTSDRQLIIATDRGVTLNPIPAPVIPIEGSIKPIFKYPSWKYPGQFANDSTVAVVHSQVEYPTMEDISIIVPSSACS